MVRDAMAGNRELTISLMRGEAESGYTGVGSVYETACLGRIETCEELENGGYDIVVVGLYRVRIVRETQQFPYPMADVEIMPELDLGEYSDELVARHNRISGLFARFLELATGGNKTAGEIMLRMDFESLVNTVVMTLNITMEQKQDMLETNDIFQRCDFLSAILQQQIETLDLIRRFEHLKPENPHFN